MIILLSSWGAVGSQASVYLHEMTLVDGLGPAFYPGEQCSTYSLHTCEVYSQNSPRRQRSCSAVGRHLDLSTKVLIKLSTLIQLYKLRLINHIRTANRSQTVRTGVSPREASDGAQRKGCQPPPGTVKCRTPPGKKAVASDSLRYRATCTPPRRDSLSKVRSPPAC